MSHEIPNYWGGIGKRMASQALHYPVVEALASSHQAQVLARRIIPATAELAVRSLEIHEDNFANIQLLRGPLMAGRKIVVAPSHESLGDIAQAVYVSDAIMEEFGDFLEGTDLVTSKTLEGGEQGQLTKTSYDAVSGWVKTSHNIQTIEVVTANDVQERGADLSSSASRQVLGSIRNPFRITEIFLQGNMRGGRRNSKGELYGVGEMSDGSRALMQRIIERRLAVTILPVGLHGMHEIYGPDAKTFTMAGVKALLVNAGKEKLGMKKDNIASVHVGRPFDVEEVAQFEDPCHEIMRRIAELVPYEAKGIYKA